MTKAVVRGLLKKEKLGYKDGRI